MDIYADAVIEVSILERLARLAAIKKIAALNTGNFDFITTETMHHAVTNPSRA